MEISYERKFRGKFDKQKAKPLVHSSKIQMKENQELSL